MKKFSSVFSICLIVSVIFGNFSLPVLAYEKGGANYEQVKTQEIPVNSKATSSNVLNEPNLNLSDKELEVLKAKKLEEQSTNFKTQDKNSYLNKGLQDNSKQEKLNYVPGEILVKYKNNKINLDTSSGRTAALNFIDSKSLEKKEDLGTNNVQVLNIKDAKTVEQKIAELKNDPNIEYVEPNYKRYPSTINTNDTYKSQLWGLENTGQTINGTPDSGGVVTGTPNSDINAPEAWTINEGTNASIIVAIIDSGVAYNHPDLVNNMWDGTNCKNENGSYLGGCNHGYDFEDVDKTPLPTNSSHGTHIAGTIAAVKNNSKGIIGVAPNAKIMAIKYGFDTASEVKAIDFAIQNGAKVINASFTGANFSQSEYDAINRFKTAGGTFVAAAGNDGSNNESIHSYPSDYNLDNIISVAATDQNDNLASFSNYGSASVDVGAPGVNILSTIADTNLLNETFENVTPSNVPSGWVKGGINNKWATYNLGGAWGNVLYGQVPSFPYDNNANTTVTSPTYNLGGNTSVATIDFWTKCDTEYTGYYSGQIIYDYMALEYSSDGVNFNEIARWDEPFLDYLNGDSSDVGGAVYNLALNIPSQYLTSNFKLRFHWVTDSSLNNYDGCLVDDVKVTKYTDGSDEQYDYYTGTSMATPHVAGLVALIEGYNPNLTTAQVKNIILTTGDNKASLSGKTVSGKRINAQKALQAATPVSNYTISGTIKYYDGIKTVSSTTVILENDIGTQIATTTTNASGTYQFAGVASGGNYVVRASKTDNASGVSGADQGKIGRHIVGLELFDSIYKKIAGDVNNSGSLSGADQGKIGRFIVGLDSDLPSGAWKFYSSDAALTTLNYLVTGLTRIYSNLMANAPNQDFVGVKMGDVNNSWVNN